jgi:hypothetical protein
MSKIIGTKPNQVPTNANLGTMAYVEATPVVAFNVGLNSTFSNSGNANPITWDNTDGPGRFVYGGCYSTSTGKFTAPTKGVYQFHMNILAQSMGNGDNMEVYIRMDSTIVAIGSRMSYEPGATGESGYMAGIVSTIIECEKGAEVFASWYRAGSSGVVHANPAWSYFCGAKVSLY